MAKVSEYHTIYGRPYLTAAPPPCEWHRSGVIQDFFDPNDKVQAHRPDFRYVAP